MDWINGRGALDFHRGGSVGVSKKGIKWFVPILLHCAILVGRNARYSL